MIQRVSEGGHDVRADKIVPRVYRLRDQLKIAIPMCDFVAVYDNSDRMFDLVLTIRSGVRANRKQPLPDWAAKLTAG